MKKLLTVIVLLMLSAYSYGGIIAGIMELNVGQTVNYNAIFDQRGTVQWSTAGSGLAIVPRGTSVSVTAVKYGTHILIARLFNYSGGLVDEATLYITVLPFFDGPDIFGQSFLIPNQTYTFEVIGTGGIGYSWSFPSEYFDIISGTASNKATVRTKNKLGSEYITVKVSYADPRILTSGKKFNIGYPSKIVPRTNFVCTNDTISYQIPDASNGDPIIWTPLNNLTLISGQGTPRATFKAINNGIAKVKAELKYIGQQVILEDSKTWVGTPKISINCAMDESSLNSSYVDISRLVTFSQYTNLVIEGYGVSLSSTTDIEWQNNSGSSIFIIGNGVISNPIDNGKGNLGRVATFQLTPGTYYNLMFKIRAKNECGWSDWKYITWSGTVISGGYRSASFIETPTLETSQEIKSVKIYNLSGVLVYSNDTVNGVFDIKSTVLINGIYIIERFDGENKTSEKIILRR